MKQALVHIEKANWDSNEFNLKVGSIIIENMNELTGPTLVDSIKQILITGQKEQYKLLYLKLPHNLLIPPLTFPGIKILLADTKVLYQKAIATNQLRTTSTHVASYGNQQVNKDLLNLAFESGKYSRFKLDPSFPSGTFEKMYTTWINRSVKKEIADNVLVYQAQNNILGMLTYSIHPNGVLIGLFAVKESQQRQRIGSILLSALENSRDDKIRNIEVATQKLNVKACRFYEKNQFIIKEETNIYHIWL